MNNEEDDRESRPQSKFEWRPGDVVMDTQEETDAAIAEYEEWLAEQDKNAVTTDPPPPSGMDDD